MKHTHSNALIRSLVSLLLAGSLGHTATAAMPVNYIGVQQLAFNQDGSQILYLSNRIANQGERSNTPVIHFINTSNGNSISRTILAINPQQQLPMGFTADGFKQSVLEARGLSILHNKTGATLRTLAVPGLPNPITRYRPAQAITNASGTQQLFYAARQQRLSVIHTGNGKLLATIGLPSGQLLSLGMSGNGRTVAYLVRSAGGKHQLQLYDIYQQQVINTLEVAAQAFAPLGQPISLSTNGNYAYTPGQLVNLANGQTTALPIGQTAASAFFTADNRYLLLPQTHSQLLRFDLQSQQPQFIPLNIPAHCQLASAYDISPNGALLALGSGCHKGAEATDIITVLNARNGQVLRQLRPIPAANP